MKITVLDDIIADPQAHVSEILAGEFREFPSGTPGQVFKGIQLRGIDEFAMFVTTLFGWKYDVMYNFVRKSPFMQEEPNLIHSDEMMGDLVALLYLNEDHPDEDGTIFYDGNDKPAARAYSKFNRAVIFPTKIRHCRAIPENFGHGDKARLVQVLFLVKR